MSDVPEVTPEEIENFDKDVARGLAPLVNIHAMYTLADLGSVQEKTAEDALDEMIEGVCKENPEKAGFLIAGLLALVFHLRSGRNIHEFFEGTSQEVFPLMDRSDPTAPPR